jgi:hypothetical protein
MINNKAPEKTGAYLVSMLKSSISSTIINT